MLSRAIVVLVDSLLRRLLFSSSCSSCFFSVLVSSLPSAPFLFLFVCYVSFPFFFDRSFPISQLCFSVRFLYVPVLSIPFVFRAFLLPLRYVHFLLLFVIIVSVCSLILVSFVCCSGRRVLLRALSLVGLVFSVLRFSFLVRFVWFLFLIVALFSSLI